MFDSLGCQLFLSSVHCLDVKIIDRILVFCAKLRIVSCQLNVLYVLNVPDSCNYDYFLRLF